jgi:hypothetical protein
MGASNQTTENNWNNRTSRPGRGKLGLSSAGGPVDIKMSLTVHDSGQLLISCLSCGVSCCYDEVSLQQKAQMLGLLLPSGTDEGSI